MDVYALFLNQKALDRFKLSKSEYEIVKKAEDDAKKDKDKKDEAANGGKPKDDDATKKEDEDKKKEPVEIEFKDYEDRTERLTINSTGLQDMALTPDGEQLIYLGKNEEGYTVWQNKLRDRETKQLRQRCRNLPTTAPGARISPRRSSSTRKARPCSS